jgi:hypothetical protein
LDKTQREYRLIGDALDLEAALQMNGRSASPELQHKWAEIGQAVMDPQSVLYQDWIADIEVSGIPLDPRIIDQFI